MAAANPNKKCISEWISIVCSKLGKAQADRRDDFRQDVGLILLEKPELLDAGEQGHIAYVVRSVKNALSDKGSDSQISVPRIKDCDSDRVRNLKVTLLQNSVSLNDENSDGQSYETLIPCKKYEQADLWEKLRNETVLRWIRSHAPMLDFLLDTDKASTPAPYAWNSKPIVRAYMGADEVGKLLKKFGASLSSDERLAIKETMFNQFLHAKKAPVVADDNFDSDALPSVFSM
jgi:hypothetical protein